MKVSEVEFLGVPANKNAAGGGGSDIGMIFPVRWREFGCNGVEIGRTNLCFQKTKNI
jgi:hypothetical protein